MNIILNKTQFPKYQNHNPRIFIIDAKEKILGRLATHISNLLIGKYSSFYTPGVDQGNFVIVLNSKDVILSGKKEKNKFYYRNSQRPGSLKKENVNDLRKRVPSRILERAVWGMLPKGVLGRNLYKRLYIYKDSTILFKSNKKSSILIENLKKKCLANS